MAGDLRPACRPLARELKTRLQVGIDVSRDILEFMASTFFIESPRDLRALLDDPDGSEAQSLLELLFTPDEATRVDLEEIIAKSSCTAEDEAALIDHLSRQEIWVPVRFPAAADTPACRAARHLLETWVRRLNITTRLPAGLAAVVDRNTTGRAGARIKAALRNSRVDLSRAHGTFLGRLVEKSDCDGRLFLKDLDLCLAIFSEQPAAASLYDLFMAKKRRLQVMLQQAQKFEKQLAANNIETLMLKGVRAPHIDKADARHKIARIDAVCLAVFGATDPLLPAPASADLGSFRDRDDLDRAFEILS